MQVGSLTASIQRKLEDPALVRRIEIRILPHLPLHFLPLFLVVQEDHPIAEVLLLDFPLSLSEDPGILIEFAAGLAE